MSFSWFLGRVIHGTKSGPKKQLSDADENASTKYLIDCANIGYGKSKSVAMMLAEQIALKRNMVYPVKNGGKVL